VSARFGPFEVDATQRLLLKNGSEVHLTPKAFDLLSLLVDEAPRVIRKDELHQRLWSDTFVSDATLVGIIKEIRRALDDHKPNAPIIRTAHGVGYAFAGELQRVIPPVPSVSRWIVAGTRRIAVAEGENLIGREPASTVFLDAVGISRRHARILVDPTRAVLEDLGSKNGTMVNDAPISSRVLLHDGDRIQIGPILIVYHASASGMSTETIVRSAT
jgi:DNA-binding winged helix-turn-helix (wHTH) protein